jgi:hypothetical protein
VDAVKDLPKWLREGQDMLSNTVDLTTQPDVEIEVDQAEPFNQNLLKVNAEDLVPEYAAELGLMVLTRCKAQRSLLNPLSWVVSGEFDLQDERPTPEVTLLLTAAGEPDTVLDNLLALGVQLNLPLDQQIAINMGHHPARSESTVYRMSPPYWKTLQ